MTTQAQRSTLSLARPGVVALALVAVTVLERKTRRVSRVPVAIIRGVAKGPSGNGRDLIRPEETDLFR